jgi:hypothetical protein
LSIAARGGVLGLGRERAVAAQRAWRLAVVGVVGEIGLLGEVALVERIAAANEGVGGVVGGTILTGREAMLGA